LVNPVIVLEGRPIPEPLLTPPIPEPVLPPLPLVAPRPVALFNPVPTPVELLAAVPGIIGVLLTPGVPRKLPVAVPVAAPVPSVVPRAGATPTAGTVVLPGTVPLKAEGLRSEPGSFTVEPIVPVSPVGAFPLNALVPVMVPPIGLKFT